MLFFVIIVLILVDQISKFLVLKYLKPIRTYPLIQNFFHLTYAENRGAAFSILQGKQCFLIVTTILFTMFLIYFLIKLPTGNDTRCV